MLASFAWQTFYMVYTFLFFKCRGSSKQGFIVTRFPQAHLMFLVLFSGETLLSPVRQHESCSARESHPTTANKQ